MYVFTEKEGKLSLNYPCYHFLSGALILLQKRAIFLRTEFAVLGEHIFS